MEKLFSPFSIKDCRLKNRIVMPALASFLIQDDGTITEKTIEHYRLRAAGGPAMIIMEAHGVSPEGIVSSHQARIYDDRFIEGLSRITRVMRSEGAIPAIQIHHAGRQVPARIINQKPFAPSPLPCPTIKGSVEPLTKEGIHIIVKKFGDAASRAIQAGFELIEIHGAHGYLVNQFLSRFSNIRDDEYGGDITGRARFAKEIIQEIRTRVGPHFPLSFKISAQEFVPHGLTTDESIEILKQLIAEGIDVVQVSGGNDATPEWICQPMFMKKACLAESAATIRNALNIPVMAVGRINDPFIADALISEGKVDLVCMGRGLMADPELPKKAKAGRFEDIRTCVACNKCMQSIFRKGRIECLVNPTLGREKEFEINPAVKTKKVMVVGGGPGGMNVAWISAQRGHEVSLYEKSNVLGGQLVMGSTLHFKNELKNIIEFNKRQIAKYRVTCHLNHHVTIDTVKEVNPDVAIIATGSLPLMPAIEGIDLPNTLTVQYLLNGVRIQMQHAIIIGGGSTGCEIALDLCEKGCSVTLIEMLPTIGKEIEAITKKIILQKFASHRITILTEYTLSKIALNGVFVIDKDNKERFIQGDKVIIAIGNKPEDSLYEQIIGLGIEVYKVGDCIEPRSAKEAIFEGTIVGRSI